MSFEIGNFSPVGGQARSGNSPAHWSYESETDMLSMVQAAGYFDEVGTQVHPGDFISASIMDGKFILTVASVTLSPPGVVIDGAIIGAGGAGAFPVVEFTSDTLNPVVADNETYFVMDFPTQIDVLIPENASQPFPIGAEIIFERHGVGLVVFTALGATVLRSKFGLLSISAQYSAAALKKIDTDEWTLFGDLA
ncbi:MAG: hypothetical protein KAV87_12970 [Desulfobacteraceae bacterium]|nr:hypothetical protein [Desulfobacteraceae bacterium]